MRSKATLERNASWHSTPDALYADKAHRPSLPRQRYGLSHQCARYLIHIENKATLGTRLSTGTRRQQMTLFPASELERELCYSNWTKQNGVPCNATTLPCVVCMLHISTLSAVKGTTHSPDNERQKRRNLPRYMRPSPDSSHHQSPPRGSTHRRARSRLNEITYTISC